MADELSNDPKARFDSIRHVNPYGQDYRNARELMPFLGHTKWERFEDAIERAKAACTNARETVADHFPGAGKMVALGSGAEREIPDHTLSRYGCYWVAMNGDPRKPEIAAAQAYFLAQTRRMERFDELREQVGERAHMRQELSDATKRTDAGGFAH